MIDGSITLHRKDMLKVLTDNLPPASQLTPHFSKRLISYEQHPDAVTLHFEDGTTAQADLLVGADGIRSGTRSAMYKGLAKDMEASDPKKAEALLMLARASWTGTYAYRSLVETNTLLTRYPNHQAAFTPMIVCLFLDELLTELLTSLLVLWQE